jgi:hypothetical protein
MQVDAHIAGCSRQERNGLADDRDYLRRISPQLTTHELTRDRDCKLHELFFDV